MDNETLLAISVVVNAILILVMSYFAPGVIKARKIKNLALVVIRVLDDHKVTMDEVRDVVNALKEVVVDDGEKEIESKVVDDPMDIIENIDELTEEMEDDTIGT